MKGLFLAKSNLQNKNWFIQNCVMLFPNNSCTLYLLNLNWLKLLQTRSFRLSKSWLSGSQRDYYYVAIFYHTINSYYLKALLHYTGKPWFKKLIFDQIIFDWRKIYLKNRRPEKEVLCRWIGKLRSFLYQDFTLLAAFINQLTNSCCNHHIDGTSQSDTIYWKMKPRKRMKQKVWIIFIKCQPEALHNGKYDVEGVKYINTWKKSKEICNFPVV